QVHRRLLCDDNRGVGEALSEPGATGQGLVVRGRHLVLLDPAGSAAERHRPLAQELVLAPYAVLVAGEASSLSRGRQEFSALRTELPPNVHLLTLAAEDDGNVLLRLEHQFERGESVNGSQPVTIDLL
ncbi:MA2B1 mannosidase, partial [Piaya cayana]|nr:MA2B1 mannosidase [Piaya cayana]